MGQSSSLWFKYADNEDGTPSGIQEWDELWLMAYMMGIINKEGQSFVSEFWDGKIRGQHNCQMWMKEHDEVYEELRSRIRTAILGESVKVGEKKDESTEVDEEQA